MMQLTVRDVSRLFDVPLSTVDRWIGEKSLPAQRIAGRSCFNCVELLEWATRHHVKVSPEIFDQLKNGSGEKSTLADAIEAGSMLFHLRVSNKDEALQALVKVLELPKETEREPLLNLLRTSDAFCAATIGQGIAVPRARSPIVLPVPRPALTMVFLDYPVDFGPSIVKPVAILFAIVSPTVRAHLQMVSRLSFALHAPDFRAALVRQSDPGVILREAHRLEGKTLA